MHCWYAINVIMLALEFLKGMFDLIRKHFKLFIYRLYAFLKPVELFLESFCNCLYYRQLVIPKFRDHLTRDYDWRFVLRNQVIDNVFASLVARQPQEYVGVKCDRRTRYWPLFF